MDNFKAVYKILTALEKAMEFSPHVRGDPREMAALYREVVFSPHVRG